MLRLEAKDVTFHLEEGENEFDRRFMPWRGTKFIDVQESLCTQKLFFLFEPRVDNSMYQGTHRSPHIAVYDVGLRNFVSVIPIPHAERRMKKLYAAKKPNPYCGTRLVVVCESHFTAGVDVILVRIDISSDGLRLEHYFHLLEDAVTVYGDYAVTQRNDTGDIVVFSRPNNTIHVVPTCRRYCMEAIQFSYSQERVYVSEKAFFANKKLMIFSSTAEDKVDLSRLVTFKINRIHPKIEKLLLSPDPNQGFPDSEIISSMTYMKMNSGENCIVLFGMTTAERPVPETWKLNLASMRWERIGRLFPQNICNPICHIGVLGNVYVFGMFYDVSTKFPELTRYNLIYEIEEGLDMDVENMEKWDDSYGSPVRYDSCGFSDIDESPSLLLPSVNQSSAIFEFNLSSDEDPTEAQEAIELANRALRPRRRVFDLRLRRYFMI